MELSFAWNGEIRKRLRFFVQFHLPESGSEIQCGEDSGVGPSDVANALGDLLHGVFVDVGILVQLLCKMHNLSPCPGFFGTQNMGGVV